MQHETFIQKNVIPEIDPIVVQRWKDALSQEKWLKKLSFKEGSIG